MSELPPWTWRRGVKLALTQVVFVAALLGVASLLDMSMTGALAGAVAGSSAGIWGAEWGRREKARVDADDELRRRRH